MLCVQHSAGGSQLAVRVIWLKREQIHTHTQKKRKINTVELYRLKVIECAVLFKIERIESVNSLE